MTDLPLEPWHVRLIQAIDEAHEGEQRLSYREIVRRARAAGAPQMSVNYVQQVKEAKFDPSLKNVLALCRALEVSSIWIIHGIPVDPRVEKLMDQVSISPEDRQSLYAAFLELRARRHTPRNDGSQGNAQRPED